MYKWNRLSIFSFEYFSFIIIIKCLNEILVPKNRSKHITLAAHVSAINNSPFETHIHKHINNQRNEMKNKTFLILFEQNDETNKNEKENNLNDEYNNFVISPWAQDPLKMVCSDEQREKERNFYLIFQRFKENKLKFKHIKIEWEHEERLHLWQRRTKFNFEFNINKRNDIKCVSIVIVNDRFTFKFNDMNICFGPKTKQYMYIILYATYMC